MEMSEAEVQQIRDRIAENERKSRARIYRQHGGMSAGMDLVHG